MTMLPRGSKFSEGGGASAGLMVGAGARLDVYVFQKLRLKCGFALLSEFGLGNDKWPSRYDIDGLTELIEFVFKAIARGSDVFHFDNFACRNEPICVPILDIRYRLYFKLISTLHFFGRHRSEIRLAAQVWRGNNRHEVIRGKIILPYWCILFL